MSLFEFILWITVMVILLLPPKYDPAIRLKEWLERKGKS